MPKIKLIGGRFAEFIFRGVQDKENGIEFTVDGNSFFRGTAFLPGKPIWA